MNKNSYCLVVPHYNQYAALEQFLPKLLAHGLPCILVDDGSDENVKQQLRAQVNALIEKHSLECHLIEHDANQGKGAAIYTGSRTAHKRGFTHMVQIDADGQHNEKDIEKFINESQKYPLQIILGAPQFDESAPKARLYGRKVTDFWVALETLSMGIKDSLCGFRVYPLTCFNEVREKCSVGLRMDFDTDFIVKSIWMGVQVRFIETKVIYTQHNDSHFHYLNDNLRLIWLHIRLMCGMFIRLPKLLRWRLSGHWASTNK